MKVLENMLKETDSVHEQIAKLCLARFNSLPKRGKPKEDEWTILSCIVQENSEYQQMKVVALGTGTKCIGQDKMSQSGDILNDSHAEVIARRAFLRYLYEDMLQEGDILKFDNEKKVFTLKESLKFNFFTTHVPCGDAAIFSKQDAEHFGDLINSKQDDALEGVVRKKPRLEANSDIFRTGAKCLEADVNQDPHLDGANYHITGVVRTKPGRGTRTLSVSCSDKLAKWCHLGVQGALLSILLEKPIYFTSFTIAGSTPYDEDSLHRALFKRLDGVQMDQPYYKSSLKFGQAKTKFPFFKSSGKKPCPSSIVWFDTKNSERQIEVSVEGRRQGVTKKQLKAGRLKICKAELFGYFQQVVKQFSVEIENLDNLTYKQAKLAASDYQIEWNKLKEYFNVWPVKDDALLNFSI